MDLGDLKDISKTQVIASGMKINDILKPEFIEDLNKKFKGIYEEIIASDIRLMLIPKQQKPELKEEEQGLIINISSTDFIRFEQPSPDHFKENVVVITTNKKGMLDEVLK